MSTRNFIRIQPPLPVQKSKPLPDMPVNSSIIVNDPFKTRSTKKDHKNNRSKRSRSRSRDAHRRRRTRSRSRERRRSPPRNRDYGRRRSRSRTPVDARAKIRSRHDEDKARGERRISNLNKMKGLQRKLEHTEAENVDLKRRLKERDFQYSEMKKRAMSYKQRLSTSSGMGMQYFQPNFMAYPNFQPQTMPRSISNETIICPTYSMAS